MRRLAFGAAFLLFDVFSRPAHSAPQQPQRGAASCSEHVASQQFSNGTALAHSGEHAAAIAAFTAAYRCKAHPAALYNIAQSYIHMGNYAVAHSYLEQYLSEHEGPMAQTHEDEVRVQMRLLVAPTADEPSERPSASDIPGGSATGDAERTPPPTLTDAEATRPARIAAASDPEIQGSEGVTPMRQKRANAIGGDTSARAQSALAPATTSHVGDESSSGRTLGMILAGTGLVAGGAALGVLVSNHGRHSEWEKADAELERARLTALSSDRAQELNARQLENNRRAESVRRYGIAVVALSASAVIALLAAGYVELTTAGPVQADLTLEGNDVSLRTQW